MSLVPVACQESQLNADGSTHSECKEWLLDLQNKVPIWSRLLDINTSGYKRKLPLCMTGNYDVEVKGRLWSLWGSKRKHRNQHKPSKSYMAVTVMALCAARVLSLNGWNAKLMDAIKNNGRLYFKESIRKSKCRCKDFQLENLLTECNLEGIQFKLHLKTVQKGFLYSTPLKCQTNLAFALIHFFDHYKFGILECCNRLLGFGFVDGPQGGYFMYDAQSFNAPIFLQNISAPYLLRMNHLQVLLYCLVVALNVHRMEASFCLHHVEILVEDPYDNKILSKPLINTAAPYPRLIPSELWKTSDDQLIKSESATNNLKPKLAIGSHRATDTGNETQFQPMPFQTKYHRKIHNIREEKVQQSPIKPLVDADRKSDEDLELKKDFVHMICSDTALPLTTVDLPQKSMREFSCNVVDALFMGPKTCLMFKNL